MTNDSFFVRNWKSYNEQKHKTASELTLYSDSSITGDGRDSCGPYQFINLAAYSSYRGIGHILPIMVLRVYYNNTDTGNDITNKHDNALYHGGTRIDEIVSLSSLFLGIRLKASDVTREFFNVENNPMGNPVGYSYTPPPTLSIHRRIPILPIAQDEYVNLSNLKMMHEVLSLSGPQQTALIKTAQLYQDALWIAESDPNTAWLFLISAIETLAQTDRNNSTSHSDLFKEFHPKLCQQLEAKGHQDSISLIADEFAHITKATKKFIDFSLEFLPDPPQNRPAQDYMKIDWSKEFWKETLKTIYNYRSKALHTGAPFPLPMLASPFIMERTYSEKGTLGVGVTTNNASWTASELPINLNLFAYVTREIVLNWLHKACDVNQTKTAI